MEGQFDGKRSSFRTQLNTVEPHHNNHLGDRGKGTLWRGRGVMMSILGGVTKLLFLK